MTVNNKRPPSSPRANDRILFVGLGDGAAREAANLPNVTTVRDSAVNDRLTDASGRTYNLTTREGAASFVKTLRLSSPVQAAQVADAIRTSKPDSRDELAQIARVWATAEKGGQIPSRLVLSGHSTGHSVFGDHNGRLEFAQLKKLATAMPRAAAQVEDLHVSGCYTGSAFTADTFRDLFPNLQTFWGYNGSAPGTDSGALIHESAWEHATRGRYQGGLSWKLVKGTYKGDHVATWTWKDGYENSGNKVKRGFVAQTYKAGQPLFDKYFSGATAVTDPQSGPLRDYYNTIQQYLGYPRVTQEGTPNGVEAKTRQNLEARRDQTIRLLFFTPNVAGHFDRAYAGKIKAGFQALKLPVPQFGALPSATARAQSLALINQFERRLAASPRAPAAAQQLSPLLAGLKNLDPAIIPDNWV